MTGSDDVQRRGRGDDWSIDLTALDNSEQERHALFDEWLQVGTCEIIEHPNGYAFWLDPDCHIAKHVEEFVALERRCLPFLGFHILTNAVHHGPVLEVSGPEGVKNFVAKHYGIRTEAVRLSAPIPSRSDDDKTNGRADEGSLGDDEFGLWDGVCQACDAYSRVDDTSLCEDCSGKLECKLERDLIRKRDWAYSALAYGCPKSRLEERRNEIVRRYGNRLELLAEEEKPAKRTKKRRGK